MALSKPRSLSGLMLLGFFLVALPLLVAVVIAAVQIRKLAPQSETLVQQGVRATRYNRLICEQVASMERGARLYQVMENRELIDVYRENHNRFIDTLENLGRLTKDLRSDTQLVALREESQAIWKTLQKSPPKSPAIAAATQQ